MESLENHPKELIFSPEKDIDFELYPSLNSLDSTHFFDLSPPLPNKKNIFITKKNKTSFVRTCIGIFIEKQ